MKNIKKYYHIKSTVEDVFTALTNPLTIEMWTGASAVMDPVAGAEFSLWDGDITGINLEIVKDKMLKQQWYFEGEEGESIVTITLLPEGKETRIELLHLNIPDEAFDNIVDGWDRYYFKPLKLLLEE
ncbi:MAG: SRPBCC domain-containing protein [Bacteroidetes bacterium]|nr:SRPBCC domain-containing protein [Bacteroidota bacterium]